MATIEQSKHLPNRRFHMKSKKKTTGQKKQKSVKAKKPLKKATSAKKMPPAKEEKKEMKMEKPEQTAIVSLSQISKMSQITLKRLRAAAKRQKLVLLQASDGNQAIKMGDIPVVIQESQRFKRGPHKEKEAKVEKIRKDEMWFADLAEELGLSKKQLALRCRKEKIGVFNRLPELKFGEKFSRALAKADAEMLRKKYAPADLKTVAALIEKSLKPA
jgi:hypothetical protein